MRKFGFIALAVVAMAMLSACSSPPPTPTALPLRGVTTLWPDIPTFKDSTPALDTNAFFNQSPSEMMTVIYYSPKQAGDIAEFYTDQRMAEHGWKPQPFDVVKHFSVGDGQGPQVPEGQTDGGCLMSPFHGQPSALCTFSKVDNAGQQIELSIFAGIDDKTNQTMITYTRTTVPAK